MKPDPLLIERDGYCQGCKQFGHLYLGRVLSLSVRTMLEERRGVKKTMRYEDHMRRVRELEEEIAKLKTPNQEGTILYLIETAETLVGAARALIKFRLKEPSAG